MSDPREVRLREILKEKGEAGFRKMVTNRTIAGDSLRFALSIIDELDEAESGKRHRDTMIRQDKANAIANRANKLAWIAIGIAGVALLAEIVFHFFIT